MPRSCVFCGGTPTTLEHVWPDWAARLVEDAGPVRHEAHSYREDADLVGPRIWQQNPFTLTVKVVCATCNNGWMSRCEDAAKPLLLTMLNGNGRDLHHGGQTRLAVWALKTALMAEHTQPRGHRAFPREVYAYLLEHGAPPANLRIWITSYTGDCPGVLHLYGLDLDARQD